jgi:hypothetical protein
MGTLVLCSGALDRISLWHPCHFVFSLLLATWGSRQGRAQASLTLITQGLAGGVAGTELITNTCCALNKGQSWNPGSWVN